MTSRSRIRAADALRHERFRPTQRPEPKPEFSYWSL